MAASSATFAPTFAPVSAAVSAADAALAGILDGILAGGGGGLIIFNNPFPASLTAFINALTGLRKSPLTTLEVILVISLVVIFTKADNPPLTANNIPPTTPRFFITLSLISSNRFLFLVINACIA